MLKDVLIIANFCGSLDGSVNNRFVYIAEMMSEKSNVELITSSFYHTAKKQKVPSGSYKAKITLIHEPGYKKNISIKRAISHYLFGLNLKKYLTKRKKPDVIYCALPTFSSAKIASKYAKLNNIKFIIDIQDLWPESFNLFIKSQILKKIIFTPLLNIANNIYASADEIVAVSETFKNRAVDVNIKYNNAISVFIGTDLSYFDTKKDFFTIENKANNEIWVIYIGTLGFSYDIKIVFDAFSILKDKKCENVKFIILGDGPLKTELEKYASDKEIPVVFHGRMDYPNMIKMLFQSDIAINPIAKGSVASIINKHGDYAMAGLPIINTQESAEYRNLIDEFRCGFNIENSNAIEIANAIDLLSKNKELRLSMGKQSRMLGERKFNREVTYQLIADLILK